MYSVLNNVEVLQAEETAKTEYGLNDDILIENAAAAIYEHIVSSVKTNAKILVLAGGGKNGADGLSAARKLFLGGYNVSVAMVSENLCLFTKERFKACNKLGVNIIEEALNINFSEYDYVIDAIIGSGLKSEVSGIVKDIITKLTEANVFTLSVDIPSGLNSDTGEFMGISVTANQTITFVGVKLGHLLNFGADYCGDLIVANIGINAESNVKVLADADAVLPKRKRFSHKYNYGRVCIIAGSNSYVGAALLACKSVITAMKNGAGLAVLCVPSSLKLAYQQRVVEATLLPMPDKDGYVTFNSECLDEIMQKSNAIAIGMGMGANDDLPKIIQYLAQRFIGTLVIDADGLNALSKDLSILDGHKSKIILTPHMGEFARLSTTMPSTDIVNSVRQLAKKLDAVIVAKSAITIISDGEQTYINVTGTSAMAKGGSGDVLAGMITALSCRFSPIKAAYISCYNFGKKGEKAEKVLGSEGVLASDLCN